MVAVKNATFIGKTPPTTPFPSYPTSGGTDPYYPKGTTLAAAEAEAAPAEQQSPPAPDPTPPPSPPPADTTSGGGA